MIVAALRLIFKYKSFISNQLSNKYQAFGFRL